MMIEFRKARFLQSCTGLKNAPQEKLPEIVFIGKSNVGKSSLINALCDNKSLAFTSSKPGHTRLLNYFEIKEQCYLVDAPGYGYSSAGQKHAVNFGEMMEDYFSSSEHIAVVCYLLDSRRVPSDDDIDFFEFLKENNLPFIIVLTKCDKLNQSEKAKIAKNIKQAFGEIDMNDLSYSSIVDKNSMENLKKKIASFIK